MYLTLSFKLNTITSPQQPYGVGIFMTFYSWKNWDLVRLSNLAKVIMLVTGKAKIVPLATPIPELIYTYLITRPGCQ